MLHCCVMNNIIHFKLSVVLTLRLVSMCVCVSVCVHQHANKGRPCARCAFSQNETEFVCWYIYCVRLTWCTASRNCHRSSPLLLGYSIQHSYLSQALHLHEPAPAHEPVFTSLMYLIHLLFPSLLSLSVSSQRVKDIVKILFSEPLSILSSAYKNQ